MAIEWELLDQFLDGRDSEAIFTQNNLLDELKKGLSERVLDAELDGHLDTETAEAKSNRHRVRVHLSSACAHKALFIRAAERLKPG